MPLVGGLLFTKNLFCDALSLCQMGSVAFMDKDPTPFILMESYRRQGRVSRIAHLIPLVHAALPVVLHPLPPLPQSPQHQLVRHLAFQNKQLSLSKAKAQ